MIVAVTHISPRVLLVALCAHEHGLRQRAAAAVVIHVDVVVVAAAAVVDICLEGRSLGESSGHGLCGVPGMCVHEWVGGWVCVWNQNTQHTYTYTHSTHTHTCP